MSDDNPVNNHAKPAGSAHGSTAEMIENLLAEGLPEMYGADESVLREQAEMLAMAIVATTKNGDTDAQRVFLDELFALGDSGAGVLLAVEHLTMIRLDGLPAGGLRPEFTIPIDLSTAPVAGTDEEQKRYIELLGIVTHLWTAKATANAPRYTHGMSEFTRSSLEDIRAMLLIMASDIGNRIERFTAWRNDGFDHWEDYRNLHPVHNAVTADMVGQATISEAPVERP